MQAMEFYSGGQLIRGKLHIPQNRPAPGVLVVPGFADTAGGIHNMHVQTARELCRNGFGVLRFDYRGLGESDGDFREFTARSGFADAEAALDVLRRHPNIDNERIGIIGFSLGALAAHLAASCGCVRALSLWAPVADMRRVFQGFFNDKHRLEADCRGWMDWMGWPIGEAFLRTAGDLDPVAAFKVANVPALVIHGTDDFEVPPSNAQAYEETGVIVRWLGGGDHLFSSVALKEVAVSLTCGWFHERLS